ncbi:MAG: formylglycine-generating enzyme family protein [Rhodanobacteraceae bacterium]|nr:formylglycine-generating enzyme family protein [Rhodanobacteraceae bacterium]
MANFGVAAVNRYPDVFPPAWASAYGDDAYGLWAELTCNDATQRLRWIAPGTFLMGSEGALADEDEKPQHPVTLSQGYWLADTACTQAFWLAVVAGDNPSHFPQDLNCPVERVSLWDIETRFLPVLQAALGEVAQVQLPSEAQWEYACRAGTRTAFAYGDTVTLEQVNYGDGSFANQQKKEKQPFRRRTVPVASLPPNPWGLYEMHGNVWEWCRDGRRDYAAAAVVDPEGPPGEIHAVRGGSWLYDARDARSAFRGALRGSLRFGYLGFRWCLRSSR